MPKKLIDVLDRVPPCMCRLLARASNGRRSLSHHDLAEMTGISPSKIGRLSTKTTWAGENIDTIVAFSTACGVDLVRPYKVTTYMVWKRKAHIRSATGHRKDLFFRIFRLMNDKIKAGSGHETASMPKVGNGQVPQSIACTARS